MSHLRLDPTRTTRLRAQFNSALMTRFDMFKRELKQFLVKGDAFGLGSKPSILFNANPEGHNQYWNPDKGLRHGIMTRSLAGSKKLIEREAGIPLRWWNENPITQGNSKIWGSYGPTSRTIDVSEQSPIFRGVALHEIGHHKNRPYWLQGELPDTEEEHLNEERRAWRFAIKNHKRLGVSKREVFQALRYAEVASKLPRGTLFPVTNEELILNAGEFRFHTDDRKLAELKKWLSFRVGQLFLKQEQDDSAQSWLGAFTKQAYSQGLKRAFDDWKKPTGVLMMPTATGEAYQKGRYAEFMRQSFGGPTPLERVRALATRTFNDLEGVTDSMSVSISRLLLDAMATGTNPREVGMQLNRIVEGHKGRGTAIARSEMIRAFNEGALDGLENLGATKIGVMVEWSTSGLGLTKLGNLSPCPKCKALQGVVLTIEEAHGMLPLHPHCSCSFIPANVGEKTDKQIRDGKRIREAVLKAAEGNKGWIGAKKKFTSKVL